MSSLTLLKQNLNIEDDLDDTILTHKLATAEAWITGHIGAPYDATDARQIEAALQLASYWFEQREAASFDVSVKAIPFGVRDLLASCREEVTGHAQ